MEKKNIKITTKVNLKEAEVVYDILWDIFGSLLKEGLTNAENFAQRYTLRNGNSYRADEIFSAYYAMSKRKSKLDKKFYKARDTELNYSACSRNGN